MDGGFCFGGGGRFERSLDITGACATGVLAADRRSPPPSALFSNIANLAAIVDVRAPAAGGPSVFGGSGLLFGGAGLMAPTGCNTAFAAGERLLLGQVTFGGGGLAGLDCLPP